MSVTYWDLAIDNLKSYNVWMICNVTDAVYHDMTCDYIPCALSGAALN